MPMDDILEEVKRLDGEAKQLKYELYKMTWFMRGGLSVDEAYNMSYEEREIVNDIIKENLETAKKTNQPFW
jgi:hypothetical protein